MVNGNATPIWVRTIPNAAELSGFDIEVSPNGGVTVGVFHRGDIEREREREIGDDLVPGLDGTNLGIFHYDENGALQWTNVISSNDSVEMFGGMCYSSDGFLHIAGTFYGSLDYADTVQSQGGTDIFVVQLSGDGNFTWTSYAHGDGEDWANDCAVDSEGTIHVVGQIEDNVDFGFITATSNGWIDLFHATISSGGVWESVVNAGGQGWESVATLIIDDRDNIIVAGTYTSQFTLGVDLMRILTQTGKSVTFLLHKSMIRGNGIGQFLQEEMVMTLHIPYLLVLMIHQSLECKSKEQQTWVYSMRRLQVQRHSALELC